MIISNTKELRHEEHRGEALWGFLFENLQSAFICVNPQFEEI